MVRVRSFSGPYFAALGLNTVMYYLPLFSPNAGKYGPEKLRILTLFTQLPLLIFSYKDYDPLNIGFKKKFQKILARNLLFEIPEQPQMRLFFFFLFKI